MNEKPRKELTQLISTHGIELIDEPRKCEGLLRDHCGENNREIFLIINALKEKIPEDLLQSQRGEPVEVLIARLTERLQTSLGFSAETALWAVNTWAIALGIIELELEISTSEGKKQKIESIVEPVDPKKYDLSETIVVSEQGDGDYFTISDAIKDASDGDQIIVKPGWYKENL